MPANDGYGVDVTYIEAFFPEHSPARFSMSAVLHGQPPLDRSRRLSWVDVGCGVGVTACMVAAANPDIDVWGFDFNPAHIERSRQLAAAAQLANCSFDEASFDDVAHDEHIGPATIDVAVIHGVYSWVSKDNIDLVAEFLRRRLSPGGLVFLSHNTSWGWASLSPLAEAMRLFVEADGRRHDLAFADSVRSLLDLETHGAAYFPIEVTESNRLHDLIEVNPRYAVHEYLVSNYRPVTFDEVAEVMAAAKCEFVGANFTTDHLRHLWGPPALLDIIGSTHDTTLQQMVRDLGVQRGFRRDLFRRGLLHPTPAELTQWQRCLRLVGLDKPFTPGDTVGIPAGGAELDPTFYGPLVDELTRRPLGLDDILELFPALSTTDVLAAMAMLVDGNYAAPESPGWRDNGSHESARRLNCALADELLRGIDRGFVVAPAIGAAVAVEFVELLTLRALWDGAAHDVNALSDHAVATLASMDWQVSEDDEFVTDPVAARAIIEGRVRATLGRIDTRYRRLGIW